MKKVFIAIFATALSLSAVVGGTLALPTSVAAAGVTYADLKVGYTKVMNGSSFVIVSGSDVVSVSSTGWVTGLKVGTATINAYSGGVHTWTFHYNVIK